MERIPMTLTGLQRIKEQLHHIKSVERPNNIRDIETAREHGDLSENAEFQYAKERQGQIAGQMQHLEDTIARAQVIDVTTLSGSKVVFGATVVVYDDEEDREFTYQIVGPVEADSRLGLISVFSPLARALIGKEAGDEAVVDTPKGERFLEIRDVRFEEIHFE